MSRPLLPGLVVDAFFIGAPEDRIWSFDYDDELSETYLYRRVSHKPNCQMK